MKPLSKLTYYLAAGVALLGYVDTAHGQNNALVVNPTSLTYAAPAGQSDAPKTLSITSTGASLGFFITTSSGQPGCTNFQLQGGQNTPANVTVYFSSNSLPTGTYNCTLTINPTASGISAVVVPVTINVGTSGTTSGQLSVTPSSLTLSAVNGGPAATGTITLTNSNASAPINFTASASSIPQWLQIDTGFGTVTGTTNITVRANPAGLASGSYTGSVTITPSTGNAITIPVTLSISGSPTIQVQQNGAAVGQVNFTLETGKSLPVGQLLSVNTGTSSTAVTYTLSVPQNDQGFLVVTPAAGSSQTTPSTISLQVSSAAASLPAGTYRAVVRISAPGATNTQTDIPVTLLVSSTPLLTVVSALPSNFNYQIGGLNPPDQTVQIGTTSSIVGNLSVTTSSNGPNWLLASLNSSNASQASPATLTLHASPAGLAPGTYTARVLVSASGVSNSPLGIDVTLVVANSTMLNATPAALTFSAQTTGGVVSPSPQTITITSTGTPLDYNATATSDNCGAFYTISQASGNTGTGGSLLTVSINTTGVTPGQICRGIVSLSSPNASNTIRIPVTLIISATPVIQINPASVNLTGTLGTSRPQGQFTVTSTDGSTSLDFTVSSASPWITILGQGSGNRTPANVIFTADGTSPFLSVGTNNGVINVSSTSLPGGGSIQVPVTLTLTSSASISVTPASLSFSQIAQGAPPASQTINVNLSGGTGPNAFTAVGISDIGNWLTVTGSGAVPGTITVTVNGANLAPGTYSGRVRISVPGTLNTPFDVPVTLTVSGANSLAVSPNSLSFTSPFGATTAPAPLTFQVSSSGGSVPFTLTALSNTCGPFFSVSPGSGTTPASGGSIITVTANPTGLSAGSSCSGTITVSSNGLVSQVVNVSLTIGAQPIAQLTAIQNGASFVPGAIAPGEIITIYGNNMGPIALTPYNITGNRFDTKVSDTEFLFDGIPAPIIYVRTDQAAVVVPFEIAGRLQTNIQIRRFGVLSNTLQQRVVDSAPGLFTISQNGTGPAAIGNQNGSPNSAASPAPKNSVIALYLTGLGQLDLGGSTGLIAAANPLKRITQPVTVTIGGTTAIVQYAGVAPGNIEGLYQVNVTVPNINGSGPQTLTVNVGGQPAQANVTVFVQ